ncbi:MAG: S8 family serine peptidase [Candidatus Omnitrophica bacterium]|nr:S8 family serine peptidase [Candidatus Omnitrophota bacterium]
MKNRHKKVLIAILTITGILFSLSAYGESDEDTENLIRAANQCYSSGETSKTFQKLLYPVAEKNNIFSPNSSPVIYVSPDDISAIDALSETQKDERGLAKRFFNWAKEGAKEAYDYVIGGLGEVKNIVIGREEKGEEVEGKRGENITIAIIDPKRINPTYRLKTGEYLGEKLWTDTDGSHGWNFAWNNNSIFDNSTLTHSTICASCALEAAPESKIMHLTIGDLPKAVRYAVDNDAKVISMSFKELSSDGRYADYDPKIQGAINYAHSKGVIIINSADNDNCNLTHYPVAYDNVIGVAGTLSGERWEDSNYGDFVDIAAPVDFNTKEGILGIVYNSRKYGTSISAPRVAGTMASVWSEEPSLDATQVVNLVLNTADKEESGWNMYAGYGEVNLTAALQTVSYLPDPELNSSERYLLLNQPIIVKEDKDKEIFSKYPFLSHIRRVQENVTYEKIPLGDSTLVPHPKE